MNPESHDAANIAAYEKFGDFTDDSLRYEGGDDTYNPDAEDALYQTFAGLTDKERFADLDAHTTALGEYLVNRPDLYEVTATKSKGWLSTGTEYSVSFAELVIE